MGLLKDYIEAENALAQERKRPGEYIFEITSDEDHWASYGVYTVEQYKNYMLVEAARNVWKSEYGFKRMFTPSEAREFLDEITEEVEKRKALEAINRAKAEADKIEEEKIYKSYFVKPNSTLGEAFPELNEAALKINSLSV